MKFTVSRDQALASMNRLHRVVERRNTIPILGHVLLRAGSDGTLTLKATDLDLEISETLPATVQTAGAATAPAIMVHDILRKMPLGAEVSFEAKDGTIAVKTGRSRFSLHSLAETDMPGMGDEGFDVAFAMPAAEMKTLLERTSFAISTEETRYYLNGIYLHVVTEKKDRLLRAVATDGHRLAQAQTAAPKGSESMPGVIFPRKAVGETLKMVEGSDGEVSVELSRNKIRLTSGSVVLTSKLIDGTFPDYGRVIPQNNERTMAVDKRDFESAVDRVSTIATERGRAIKLALDDNRLTLTVNNPDSGAAVEEMDVEHAAGGTFEIGFNSRYLLDICGELQGERALLKFSDPGAPALVSSPDDASSLFVLMPMRV